MKAVALTARIILFLALTACWISYFPHRQVSDFIGAHFPWPSDKAWKWSALLVEGALTQLLTTIPAAVLLAVAFRNWALRVALVLCVIFAVHAVSDWFHVPDTAYGHFFILWLMLCHTLLLVGITIIATRHKRSMLLPVPAR